MGTHKSMFTKQSTCMGTRIRNFTEKIPRGYLRFVVFCVATVHSPFSSAHTASYKQLHKKHKKLVYFCRIFF